MGNTTFMTVHEVAQELRVDDTTVRRWIQAGVFPAIPLPHRGKRQQWRILRRDFDKVVNREGTPFTL